MFTTRPSLNPLVALILPLVFAASSIHSAPASSDELASTTETRSVGAAGGGITAAVTATTGVLSGTQSKTVELLLQLQDQPNAVGKQGSTSIDPTRRGSTSPSSPATPPKPDAAEADDNPLRALKSAILRDAAPRQASSETGSASPTGAADADRRSSAGGGPGHSGSTASEPKESLLAHPVVRFIRENRIVIIVACLAALAAVWLTASFSMRGSR